MIDHDRLFKELLSTFFIEFIELFLPEMMAYIEPESVTFLDKELFTDVTAGEKYETDLLTQVRFKGKPSFFLIHIENQASAEANFGQRIFRYFARLYEKYNYPVYPIVVFSYDKPKVAAPSEFKITFPDFSVLQFNYRVIQLNQLSWRDFLNQKNPVAAALMAKMNIAPADRAKVKAECLRLLVTLKVDPAREQLISGFIDTYLQLNAEEKIAFDAAIEEVSPSVRGTVMKIVTSWQLEGRVEGRVEGREEGRQSTIKIATKFLSSKLGQLPTEIAQKIAGLTLPQVDQLSDQIFAIQTVNMLDSWLNKLEAEEGFEGIKADGLNQLRGQVGAIAPNQKQQLLELSPEQWQTLSTLELENIEALDSWLSSTRTESD
ncbi:MAG: DUF4351 domain-containing protein [Cyanobacteria bacterium J06634_6]